MFYKLKLALSRFMYGRYGADNLNRALLVTYIVIAALHFIISLFSDSVAVYLIFSLMLWTIIGIAFFRMFSRNIYKRQRENDKYLRLRNSFISHARAFSGNLRERDKKYVVCPACKAVVRFPAKKGTHSAQCPKCRTAMTVKVR